MEKTVSKLAIFFGLVSMNVNMMNNIRFAKAEPKVYEVHAFMLKNYGLQFSPSL